MAKKKGKKASTSPSSSGKHKEQHKPNDDSIDMEELQLLENPDLSKLSPMQAEKVLKVIEDLENKIQNKVASDACEEQPESDAEKASRSNTDSVPQENVDSAKHVVESVISELTVVQEKDKGKEKQVVEEGIVNSAWRQDVRGSKMFQLCRKLDALRYPLQQLNKEHFAGIDRKEEKLRARLHEIQETF
ncbi:hypothetical protein RIF29_15083 [Crotalaria pallida]|uniref:Uncharacterized protein n=1 Tax=Crotalaria pallida TaxID=3830 RepID=A0AAN9IAX0_CROPI